jgi:hypothetical protein
MNHLEELLYNIKINNNPYYVNQLVKNKQIDKIIFDTCRRYKIRRMIVERWIKEYTLKYYRYSEIYTIERYCNEIQKYIGRKAIDLDGERTTRE